MAKPLHQTPPTSSVSRLLDASAAMRATAPAPAGTPVSGALPVPMPVEVAGAPRDIFGEVVYLKREFVVTLEADEAITRLVEAYRRATRTRMTASHVLRSVALAVERAMPTLEREAQRLGPMRLPSNARSRRAERERFERAIAAAFTAGMRAAAAMEEEPEKPGS